MADKRHPSQAGAPPALDATTDPSAYHRTQIVLHWLVVILVLVQFLFGPFVSRAFGQALAVMRDTGAMPLRGEAVAHGFVGTLIFGLMVARLWMRFSVGAPPPPRSATAWSRPLALANHVLFYALLLAMPVFGHIAWWLGAEWSGALHAAAARLLLVLIALHIAGAAFHHIVKKDGWFLHRMAPSDPADRDRVGPGRK